jgi:hypothetical protein
MSPRLPSELSTEGCGDNRQLSHLASGDNHRLSGRSTGMAHGSASGSVIDGLVPPRVLAPQLLNGACMAVHNSQALCRGSST